MYSYFNVYVFVLLCMFYFVYSVPLCCSVHYFMCKCVMYYCHRLSTQLQLTNMSNSLFKYLAIPCDCCSHCLRYIVTNVALNLKLFWIQNVPSRWQCITEVLQLCHNDAQENLPVPRAQRITFLI